MHVQLTKLFQIVYFFIIVYSFCKMHIRKHAIHLKGNMCGKLKVYAVMDCELQI